MSVSSQHEILQTGPLLDPQGKLTTAGWSRQPLLDCNLEHVNIYKLRFLQPLRIKRWDYYSVFTPSHFFSFTISDVGYLEMVFAYVIDFETGDVKEETISIPFGSNVQLPRNSTEGISQFQNKHVAMRFEALERERRVTVDWPNFGKTGLSADLHFDLPPEHESMTIVIPIRGNRFYYNRKINVMPVRGIVNVHDRQHNIEPHQALGGLDWGRGIWEYDSFWVWASSSGFLPDGRRIGLNMGYGFGDTSAATENALILDGKIHKLAVLDFNYNPHNFMQPWTMKSTDGRVDLEFTPFLDRTATTDLKLLYSEVHQMFGRYNGRITSDAGEAIQIRDMIGFAEEHNARW